MKTNIVLIGLPGSGKTSAGQLLSKKLNYTFRDVDLYIEESTEQSIPELFQKSESHFRRIEKQACSLLAKRKQTVIAAGGGIVKDPENILFFKPSSLIVFVDRPVAHILKDIDPSHRPLLKDNVDRLNQLHTERHALYLEAADIVLKNDQTLEAFVDKLILLAGDRLPIQKGAEQK